MCFGKSLTRETSSWSNVNKFDLYFLSTHLVKIDQPSKAVGPYIMYSMQRQAVAVINWAPEVCLSMRSFSWKMKNWYWMEKQHRAQCLKLLKNVQIIHLSTTYVAHFDPKNYSVYTINFAGGKVRVGHVRGHMSMVLSWPSISFAHWKWIPDSSSITLVIGKVLPNEIWNSLVESSMLWNLKRRPSFDDFLL